MAVVDTACTKTVAGEEWYMNYIKDLPGELNLLNQIHSLSFEIDTKVFFKKGHTLCKYC